MKLAYRFEINERARLCELCRISNNLYNQALYIIRQSLEHDGKWLFYSDMDKIMKETRNMEGDVNYKLLKAQVSQQILRVLDKAVKSYATAIKYWSKYPEKYKGKPEMPTYHKRGGMSNLYYTNQACQIRDGYITLEKGLRIVIPQWKKYGARLSNFQQVRIIPKQGYMIVEVVYELANIKEQEKGGVAGIDLGINNLVTLVSSDGAWLFDGRAAKSYNRWFNKALARIASIKDKQGVNMGKVNNRKFTFLPLSRLKWCLEYKCRQNGIRYVEHEESYTSKCDALALELVGKHKTYSGKRVRRGLFQSMTGKLINADVNGDVNIVRKVFGDSLIADSGQWYRQARVNTLKYAV